MLNKAKKSSDKDSKMLLCFLICMSGIKLLSACREEYVFCNIKKNSENEIKKAVDGRYGKLKEISDYEIVKRQTARFQNLSPIKEDYKERTACESEIAWIEDSPTHAYTEDGRWKKLKDNQIFLKIPIRVERCKNLDKPCFNVQAVLSRRRSTKCVQKYIEVPIQVQANQTSEILKFPASCVCSVTSHTFPKYYFYERYNYNNFLFE